MNRSRVLLTLLLALPLAACGRPTVAPTGPATLQVSWSLLDLATSTKVDCLADEQVRVELDGLDETMPCSPEGVALGDLAPGEHVVRASLLRDGASEWTTDPVTVDAALGEEIPVSLVFGIAPAYGTQPVSWTVVDALGNPVSCAGQTISFQPNDETKATTFDCGAGSADVPVFSGFRELSAWIGDGSASGVQTVAVTVPADRTAPPISLVFVP